MRSTTLKPAENTLIARAAVYWGTLILANVACLGLMAMLLFR